MAHQLYDNFFLSNEVEDQFNSHLDLQSFCTIDDPLEGVAGMKRIINTPKRGIGEATVEALEMLSIDEGKTMLEIAKNASAYPSLGRSASKLIKFAEMMEELRNGYEQLSLGVLVEKVLAKSGYMEYL